VSGLASIGDTSSARSSSPDDGLGAGRLGRGVVVALNQASITTNQTVASEAGNPGFGVTAEIAGQSVGGGVLLTDPGSTAINTTITENEAITGPNAHGTLG